MYGSRTDKLFLDSIPLTNELNQRFFTFSNQISTMAFFFLFIRFGHSPKKKVMCRQEEKKGRKVCKNIQNVFRFSASLSGNFQLNWIWPVGRSVDACVFRFSVANLILGRSIKSNYSHTQASKISTQFVEIHLQMFGIIYDYYFWPHWHLCKSISKIFVCCVVGWHIAPEPGRQWATGWLAGYVWLCARREMGEEIIDWNENYALKLQWFSICKQWTDRISVGLWFPNEHGKLSRASESRKKKRLSCNWKALFDRVSTHDEIISFRVGFFRHLLPVWRTHTRNRRA